MPQKLSKTVRGARFYPETELKLIRASIRRDRSVAYLIRESVEKDYPAEEETEK